MQNSINILNTNLISYPFGMVMPNRATNSDNYRYAYNGMEQDKEVSGNGNSYTTEFRQYDPRLGRWKSLDPVIHSSLSPYNSFSNNPITNIDPEGNTDYYTLNGKKIGTDGNDNGKRQVVLSRATIRKVKKRMKEHNSVFLNQQLFPDVIDVTTTTELDYMKSLFRLTEQNNSEYDFEVFVDENLEVIVSDIVRGSLTNVNPYDIIECYIQVYNYKHKYGAHTHPNIIIWDPYSNGFTSGETESGLDRRFKKKNPGMQSDVLLTHKNSKLAMSSAQRKARANPNGHIKIDGNAEKIIVLYNKNESFSMKFDKFDRGMQNFKTKPSKIGVPKFK